MPTTFTMGGDPPNPPPRALVRALPRTLAFVITAHGYGHASRQMEVIRVLLERRPDARAIVLSVAPESVFEDYLGALPNLYERVRIVPYRADVGLVQKDGLAMDREATLRALSAAWSNAEGAEDALARELAAHRPDLVIADVPPVAFGAASRLGVPSIAVGNFDWASIYGAYAEKDAAFVPWRELALRWHARASAALHLEPGPPLSGFARCVEVGVVARRLLVDVRGVRERLGIPAGHRAVLVSFGGFGLDDAARRIPRVPGITWILAPPMADLRRDDARFIGAEAGIPYVALLAACDATFTKPGYGIVAEATAHRTRVVYTDRGDFPEYPHLVRWLHEHAPAAFVPSAELGSERGAAALARALEEVFAAPDRWPDRADGGERVADEVETLLDT
jgi:hypothetical protein